MTRRCAWLLLAVGCGSAASTASRTDERGTDPSAPAQDEPPRRDDANDLAALRARLLQQPLSERVVVRRVYASAEEARRSSAEPAPVGSARRLATVMQLPLSRELPFRVIADRDVVELESIAEGYDPECPPPWWGNVRVRAWARRQDLLPVLARAITEEREDGTGYTIEPGAPLVELEDARYGGLGAVVHGRAYEVGAPSSAIALSYAPSPPRGARGRRLTTRAVAWIDGHQLQTYELAAELRVVSATEPDRVSGERLIDLESGLMRLRIRARTLEVTERSERPSCGGTLEPTRERVEVREGQPLYFPDGRPAGSTLRTFSLAGTVEAAGDRACVREIAPPLGPSAWLLMP